MLIAVRSSGEVVKSFVEIRIADVNFERIDSANGSCAQQISFLTFCVGRSNISPVQGVDRVSKTPFRCYLP